MKRPIDIMRDGAGSASIPKEHGRIIRGLDFKERLLIIAENGIVSAQFADEIDPDRTNSKIPQIIQKTELSRGSTSPVVAWTFLTAIELLQHTHLAEGFPVQDTLARAYEVAKWLSEIQDIADQLAAFQANLEKEIENGAFKASNLPSYPNLIGSTEHVIHLARKAAVEIMWLTNLFYPKVGKNEVWHKALNAALDGLQAAEPYAVKNLRALIDFIEAVNNYRNAFVHPDKTKSLEVYNYELGADMRLRRPSLVINHPNNPVPREDLFQFVTFLADQTAQAYEGMLANLVSLNLKPFGPFVSEVAALPEGQFREGVRFALHTYAPDGFPPTA